MDELPVSCRAQQLIEENGDSADTALLSACADGDIDVAVCLIKDFGASVDAVDEEDGSTPLLVAAQCGHHQLIRVLAMEFGAKLHDDALFKAASGGHHEAVRLLVRELGANVDAQRCSGWTSLHIAIQGDHHSVIRTLADEFGADIGAKTGLGLTPLHRAVKGGNLEVVRLLVEELGADVHVGRSGNDGETLLHLAAGSGNCEVIRLVAKGLGGGVDTKNNIGWTPLQCIVTSRRRAC